MLLHALHRSYRGIPVHKSEHWDSFSLADIAVFSRTATSEFPDWQYRRLLHTHTLSVQSVCVLYVWQLRQANSKLLELLWFLLFSSAFRSCFLSVHNEVGADNSFVHVETSTRHWIQPTLNQTVCQHLCLYTGFVCILAAFNITQK